MPMLAVTEAGECTRWDTLIAWRSTSKIRSATTLRTGIEPDAVEHHELVATEGVPGELVKAPEAYAHVMPESSSGAGWERMFWLVFERSSSAIFVLDDRRRVVHANNAALALLGRSRGAVIGSSIVDSVAPSERLQSEEEWLAFLRSGEYAGTRIFLLADGSEAQIDFAARLVVVGQRRLAIYVALAQSDSPRSAGPTRSAAGALTKRERQIVTLIALGRETGEIAQELHISPETVRTHVRNAMSKLGARTRAQLVANALCSERAVHLPDLSE
jgi:PAS domain S-box-containing protein